MGSFLLKLDLKFRTYQLKKFVGKDRTNWTLDQLVYWFVRVRSLVSQIDELKWLIAKEEKRSNETYRIR